MLGTLGDVTYGLPDGASLNLLAGNFALWASVSEARATRAESSRDLVLLSAAVGAAGFAIFAPLLARFGDVGPELVPVSGAICVIYNCHYRTNSQVKRRIIGTLVGVPVALAFLPPAATMPVVVWAAAALAMVIYAMALSERYDTACGAYAF